MSKIIHGESYSELEKLSDNSVDMVFTDPPYKINQDYGTTVDADRLVSVASIINTMRQVSRVLKPGRFAAVFYDNRILPLMMEAVRGTELIYQRQLFLYRQNSVHAFCWHGWMNCTDPILLFLKGGAKKFYPANKPNVKHDTYTRNKMNEVASGHPAQKPQEVIEHIIQWCTDEGELVVDPYCGGGSILRSAASVNREYLGIEINRKWADVALQFVNLPNNRLHMDAGDSPRQPSQSTLEGFTHAEQGHKPAPRQ